MNAYTDNNVVFRVYLNALKRGALADRQRRCMRAYLADMRVAALEEEYSSLKAQLLDIKAQFRQQQYGTISHATT